MSRTSRTNILSRFAGLAGSIGCGVWLFMFVMGVAWPLLPVLCGAFVGIGLLVLFCWAGTRAVGHLMFGNDPDFQAWCRQNDPYFDLLPWPFRAPESGSAPYFCRKCGGAMYVPVGICPSCGFGKDQMQCPCGTEVTQPHESAFDTVGVVCPNCRAVLKR